MLEGDSLEQKEKKSPRKRVLELQEERMPAVLNRMIRVVLIELLLSRDLREMRELAMWVSGGRVS